MLCAGGDGMTVQPGHLGNTPVKRVALTEEDIRAFARDATAYGSHTPDLRAYQWQQSRSLVSNAVCVYDSANTVIAIPFMDIVPAADGVFFYGWNETRRIAVWKWVPNPLPRHGTIWDTIRGWLSI
jgi:hypothetical protein